MSKDFSTMENSNTSANPSIHQVSEPERRQVIMGGLAASMAALFGGSVLSACSTPGPANATSKMGFRGIATSVLDTMSVPEGYVARAFMPWREPSGFRDDLSDVNMRSNVSGGLNGNENCALMKS